MPRNTFVSPLAPGAGRYLDYSWPKPALYFGTGDTRNVYARIANSNASSVQWTFSQGPGSTDAYVLQNNVPALKFVSGNAINAGIVFRDVTTMALRPRLGRSFIPALNDDQQVWRVVCNMAFGGIPSADCDYGIELVFPAAFADHQIFLDNTPGFGFVRRASGAVAFVVNTPGLTFTPVTTPAFDPTVFHTYEMRLASASAAVDATVTALVDDAPLVTFAWGAGTILPSYNAAFPQIMPCLSAYADANKTLFIERYRLCCSQTLQGTL